MGTPKNRYFPPKILQRGVGSIPHFRQKKSSLKTVFLVQNTVLAYQAILRSFWSIFSAFLTLFDERTMSIEYFALVGDRWRTQVKISEAKKLRQGGGGNTLAGKVRNTVFDQLP